jgi:hypothetical protein
MSLKISKGSLFEKSFLVVDKKGIKVYSSAISASTRRIRFDQIECVLMSADNRLSVQVGQDIFTIQTDAGSEKHQAVIDALLAGIQQTPAPA